MGLLTYLVSPPDPQSSVSPPTLEGDIWGLVLGFNVWGLRRILNPHAKRGYIGLLFWFRVYPAGSFAGRLSYCFLQGIAKMRFRSWIVFCCVARVLEYACLS